MYSNTFETVLSLNVKDNDICHNIRLSYNIQKDSVMCQPQCTCPYKTTNIVVLIFKNDGNTCPKGRAMMKMYRVVSQTKIGNYLLSNFQTKLGFTCYRMPYSQQYIQIYFNLYIFSYVTSLCLYHRVLI